MRLVAAGVVAAAGLLAACGPDEPETIPVSGLSAAEARERVEVEEVSDEVTLVAQDIAFDTERLAAPAGVPLEVTFDNRDENVPHNLRFTSPSGETVATEIETGPVQQVLTLSPDEAGTYAFICDVHPREMQGSLEVG